MQEEFDASKIGRSIHILIGKMANFGIFGALLSSTSSTNHVWSGNWVKKKKKDAWKPYAAMDWINKEKGEKKHGQPR